MPEKVQKKNSTSRGVLWTWNYLKGYFWFSRKYLWPEGTGQGSLKIKKYSKLKKNLKRSFQFSKKISTILRYCSQQPTNFSRKNSIIGIFLTWFQFLRATIFKWTSSYQEKCRTSPLLEKNVKSSRNLRAWKITNIFKTLKILWKQTLILE